jgi:hypothetical protein
MATVRFHLAKANPLASLQAWTGLDFRVCIATFLHRTAPIGQDDQRTPSANEVPDAPYDVNSSTKYFSTTSSNQKAGSLRRNRQEMDMVGHEHVSTDENLPLFSR